MEKEYLRETVCAPSVLHQCPCQSMCDKSMDGDYPLTILA